MLQSVLLFPNLIAWARSLMGALMTSCVAVRHFHCLFHIYMSPKAGLI